MKQNKIAPSGIIESLVDNFPLIRSLVKRENHIRYQGSALGVFWSFFNPLLMLVVYTFVFSVVFKVRWTPQSTSKVEFALILFTGLLVFNLLSECLNKAPNVIVQNANYVKRVVFPLEIMSWVTFGSALFHFGVSLIVWVAFYLIFFGAPPWTILLLPMVLLPLVLLCVGLGWILGSLGVYLRDTSQLVSIISMAMMFLSPIFFPSSALPPEYQSLLALNPMTFLVESARSVMIWGKLPLLSDYLISFGISLIVAVTGFAWFQKTRNGFADVL
jgi:lipopolysaccharide transport system permease protein